MPEAPEIHHRVPRRLLAAHDRMRAHTALNGEALQLWFEYEGLLLEFGLDPDISREELEQAITLTRSLARLCEAEGLEVRESGEELDALDPGANGLYSSRRSLILLRETLSEDQKAKSLTHELAHHLLHRDAPAAEAERPTLEAEAEGTAYAVLSYFGVDASSYSFAYVAHWAEQREVVKAVLAGVQRTAHAIIEAVEDGPPRAEKSLDRGAA
jgi:hypothetical protein